MADTTKPDPKKPQTTTQPKPAATQPTTPPKPAGGGYPPMR